jgi:hypothetical protein
MMYDFECYLNRHFKRSQSCFFMPCAPQSIQEEDQKAALFAGLFHFVAQKLRNQYQDCAVFGNHVEERFSLSCGAWVVKRLLLSMHSIKL